MTPEIVPSIIRAFQSSGTCAEITTVDREEAKQLVGRRAVDILVADGMRLALGTGSTAIHAIRQVAYLHRIGRLPNLLIVPTSTQTQIECWKLGLPLCSLNDVRLAGTLDLVIDGADEVDPQRRLVKGAGGAMLLEKVMARAATRYAIVVDRSKMVAELGQSCPIPVEVLPEALAAVQREVRLLGAKPMLREGRKKSGPTVTDHGNFIVDLIPPSGFDPVELERSLNLLPGVLENGLFTLPVHDLFIGDADGVQHIQTTSPIDQPGQRKE